MSQKTCPELPTHDISISYWPQLMIIEYIKNMVSTLVLSIEEGQQEFIYEFLVNATQESSIIKMEERIRFFLSQCTAKI